MIRKLACASLLFLLVACKKEEPAPTQVNVVPPEPAPATATTTTPPAEPAVDLETLAVEEDFEEEAEKEITAANLEKKVAELEKEMAAD